MNTLLLESIKQTELGKDSFKIAVSYIRVSTKRQAEKGGREEGFSIPAQREANKAKAKSLSAIVTKEFVDRGESAKTADRPALQEMLEFIKNHQVDYVIVHKLDRLARNRIDDALITQAIKETNCQLISTTESFDDATPHGQLLHGVMSSVAEFYSANLAFEVKKGMKEKVQNGGTPSKAPIGYFNVRKRDDKGREIRTVELDPERAPFITRAFNLYAEGTYTMATLADKLAREGLTTVATPRIPSKPINQARLNTILINPYYKGLVKYDGALHKGKHPKIIDPITWQKVQDIIKTHRQGERTRKHPHFLKSTVWCGSCHGRLLVQVSRSQSGELYHYLMCGNRHAKRNNCQQRSIQTHEVEKAIEKEYERIKLTPDEIVQLEKELNKEFKHLKSEEKKSRENVRLEKDKLLRKQQKLIDAHFAEAITLDLLKSEQQKITRALNNIEAEEQALESNYETVQENLKLALSLASNVAKGYKQAPDHIKKMLNQIFFEKVYVHNGNEITTETKFTGVYESILSQKAKTLARKGENFCQTLHQTAISCAVGLSKLLLVHPAGLEPATLCSEDRCSNPLSYGCILRLLYHILGYFSSKISLTRSTTPEGVMSALTI